MDISTVSRSPIASESGPLLELIGIEKSFPGVRALRRADFELRAGEIHALVGENGAGKSTLIKVLAGVHQPNAGILRLRGTALRIRSPHHGRQLGIAVIHQEFHLVPYLSVRENIFLGQEQARAGFISVPAEQRMLKQLFDRLGFKIDSETPCRELSVAEQQLVEIAKALSQEAPILIMDEPTAALSIREVERLFALVRELRQQGMGIVYVSHRLEEIFSLSDRTTVMRDGQRVHTGPTAELTREALIELMVGRKLEAEFPRRAVSIGAPRLLVRNLGRGEQVKDVSFELRRGEVVGLAGLVGAGRTEMVRLLFGADRADRGKVLLDGQPLTLTSPRAAIRAGLCLLTEDRKQEGLVLGLSAQENFGLPNLRNFSRWGLIRAASERASCLALAGRLRLKFSGPEQVARQLSGGNQQKLVLAKWLQARPEVLVFDEPTRGVDVGAKLEIYRLINELAAAGKAILMVSSDLPEILGMSDRVLVMREGRMVGEINDLTRATPADVLRLAMRPNSSTVTEK